MASLFALVANHWGVVFWSVIVLFGTLGLLACLWPRVFTKLANCGGTWFDTSKVVEKLDARYDVDGFFLQHSRVLGALVVAAMLLVYNTFGR